MLKSSTITLESTIINSHEVEQELIAYSKLYSSLERKLFNQLKNDNKRDEKRNELQRLYVKEHNIPARVFKNLWRQVIGKIKSLNSNNENYKINRQKKIEELTEKLEHCELSYKRFGISRKINRLGQKNKNNYKIQSVWGSKALFKKQWNREDHEEWLNEWRIRRDHNILIIGSSDETFGNSLCQLQTLHKLRLTLPKTFDIKHLMLEVDFDKKKSIYQYLKQAITNGRAITVRIFQSSKNKKWYVQLSFTIENECEDYCNGTLGIDINYNLISTCLIKPDGNKEKFIDYHFNVDDDNKDRNTQILSDIVNKIVACAKEKKKTITIEKIDLKNVLKNKKISLVCYSKIISLLTVRCIKSGVLLLEANPVFTSVIGRLKYSKPLGRSVHDCASYTVGRRGLNYVENIPSRYICLLHSEEKDKSLLAQWNIVNKRLKKVSQKERSSCLMGHRDPTTFNLNSS